MSRSAHIAGVLAGAVFLTAVAEPAEAFTILEPKENAVLKAGQPVTVKVDTGREAGIVNVKYFWYREMDETLVEQEMTASSGSAKPDKLADDKYWQKDFVYGSVVVAQASLVATVDSKPPYGGKLMVPKGAIGTVRLLAVAEGGVRYPNILRGLQRHALTVEKHTRYVVVRKHLAKQIRLSDVLYFMLV